VAPESIQSSDLLQLPFSEGSTRIRLLSNPSSKRLSIFQRMALKGPSESVRYYSKSSREQGESVEGFKIRT
jgi:hypothetical protein